MNNNHAKKRHSYTILSALNGGVLIAIVIVLTTIWMRYSTGHSADEASHSVNEFYLQELADIREHVIDSSLHSKISNLETVIGIIDLEELSSQEKLTDFMKKIKVLYELEDFGFVDANSVVYTTEGLETIEAYEFISGKMKEPVIAVPDISATDRKVTIAVPVSGLRYQGTDITTCFMELDINKLVEGLSQQTDNSETEFFNLYYADGESLTDSTPPVTSDDSNILSALQKVSFDDGFSYKNFEEDFRNRKEGLISFTYHSKHQYMYYMPVEGTDWMITYQSSENRITHKLSKISDSILRKSYLQLFLIIAIMLIIFIVYIVQADKHSQLIVEKETSEAENRAKQSELEEQLRLKNQLMDEERGRHRQNEMITALSSDYRGVYYINVDMDAGVCYRSNPDVQDGLSEGESFSFSDVFRDYIEKHVVESYHEELIHFIQPSVIRENLKSKMIATHRYLTIKDGQERYEMMRIARIDEQGEVHVIGLGLADVDEQTRESLAQNRALSVAFAQAKQANMAKTEFISTMNHEIRTPMNAIIGLDSIALMDPDLNDNTRDYLEKIGGSAKHLLTLINDVLDMNRIESGHMVLRNKEFSFGSMLEQINTMINYQCQDRGLTYECVVKGRVDDYYIGDDMKLKQALLNILDNALKFTNAPGTVSFIVERTEQLEDKSVLQFVIRDTGIGIDKEYIPKIFEAFSQENDNDTDSNGGTGLGMAIAKDIVEMMNGSIELESEKGVGTTVTINVTFKNADRTNQDQYSIRPQDMKVLVIDDEIAALDHAKQVLEEAGITPDTCLTGVEALDMVKLRHARREEYHLILVDRKMPGQDGIEVSRKLRELIGDEYTIIILTSYSWGDVIEDAIKAGVDSFVAKPLFVSNVLEEFEKAMQQKNIAETLNEQKTELKGRRILLAEDVEINVEIMKNLLNMRDIEVEHAENGQIAVDMFAASPKYYYDAILMDVRMPVLDGLGATKAIRALDRADAKNVPIIAMTANAFDEDVELSLQAGMNAHLSKPVEPEHLYETLERIINDGREQE